jgi:hypothetical protein
MAWMRENRLFIDLWVEDNILCMSYKPDKEYNHYENIPTFKTPNYEKGTGFCRKIRTKPRKKKTTY